MTKRVVRNAAIVILGAAAVIALVKAADYHVERRARVGRLPKVIASFDQVLLMYINESDRLEQRLAKEESTEWRQLNEVERTWLIDAVMRQADISSEWKDWVNRDPWDQPLRVEVRRPQSGIQFRITSAGPDGRFGTADDYDSIDKRRYR